MASRFLLRLYLRLVMVMALDLRLRLESATVRALPGYGRISDPPLYFRPSQEMARVGSLALDLYSTMATDFRRVSIVDFSAARSLPAAGSICPAVFDSGCCQIGFAIVLAGSAVVAAADFDPYPSCFAIVAVDPDSV